MTDEPERVIRVEEPSAGLVAFIVLDSTALGPAAGGVRTKAYATEEDALSDAKRLARAMTYKCALGGLAAGGGKAVVMARDDLDRPAAFAAMGRAIEALEGAFRTAGDFGTTDADLAAMAAQCRYVHTDTPNLAEAVGRGVLRCAEACADVKGRAVGDLTIAVQGAGDIGAAVVEAFTAAGATVRVADLDRTRAEAVAARTGATVVAPSGVLFEDVDLVSPCAIGDVVSTETVPRLKAWAVCGGANNICVDHAAHRDLHEAGVLFVPDLVSSAGAVIDGIGQTVMGLADRAELIDALRDTAAAILADARDSDAPPLTHALRRAAANLGTHLSAN